MASGAVDAAERITATVGGNPSDAAERSLDDLVKVVVEAAGAANRSAGAAADSTENLLRAAGDLGSLQARARRNALLMLGTVLAVSLLTLGCMVWMAMSLARSMSDLEQLGALYAKRVSDLKSEVRELRELPPLLREVADKVAQSGPPPSAPPVNLAPMTAQIRESIEQSSRQQDGRSKQLSEQVQRLQSAVETQARQLAQLRELAERGRGEARTLDEINRSLALLAAEKARPTEARPPASTPRSIVTPGESRTAATKDRDFVRYPVVPPDSK
jgi:hypothetical protein